ncbi:hypothetical protein B0H17DRAFT_1195329 [Mycena rosella]|uniref:Uncharacterized protein n=1 Tax=Mycena rosella TaxID=1033263 RepID=A0AAD7DZN8_MYCRO|nr:hypothetical protein B0H17DRAFT_1195329 [Mycena rosella]
MKAAQRRGPTPLPPAVTTLDPVRMTGANFFDISQSSLNSANYFRRIRPKQVTDAHQRQYGDQIQMAEGAFPPDTRGFLYYHSVPNQSPLGGGVRFRVAQSPDAHGFLAGHDLLMEHGLPWHIPIWQLCSRRAHTNLLTVLKADGFAPPEMLLASEKLNISNDSVLVTALGQPWVVRWNWEFSRVYFTAPDRHAVSTLVNMPWVKTGSAFPTPYSGRGLVSVIRLPDGTLGLRVDKVLQLRRDGVNINTIMPEEGLVVPFRGSLILKQTKMAQDKRMLLVDKVNVACQRLPWLPAKPNPLDVYRHRPLPYDHLHKLGFPEHTPGMLSNPLVLPPLPSKYY